MDEQSYIPIPPAARPSHEPGAEKPGGLPGAAGAGERGPNAAGLLLMNADDWGLDGLTTDRILECIRRGTVSSASAMLFMKDSERAAAIARESNLDVGLHLNLTTPFSGPNCPPALRERQRQVGAYLLSHRLAQAVFHPGLSRAFEYVVQAQQAEFCRLYGRQPARIDGHHHAHLCSNILLKRMLPPGIQVRRNFSFQPGEKKPVNRAYRRLVDYVLARRYRVVDYFFSLVPLDAPGRLRHIFGLAKNFTVEVETHPANLDEYNFLMGEEIHRMTSDVRIALPAQGRKLVASVSSPSAP